MNNHNTLTLPENKNFRSSFSGIFKNLIKFSLFSYVFFAPVSISAAQISLGLGFIGWIGAAIASPQETQSKIVFTRIGHAYLLFLAAGIISAIFTEEKFSAFQALRSFWVFFAFLLAVNWIKSVKDLESCLVILVSVTSSISLVGFIQYLGGLSLLGHQLISPQWQATGFYRGAMTYSGLLLVISLATSPVFFPRKLIFPGVLWVVPLSLMVMALLLAQQRGVWLGFAGGAIFLGFLRSKKTLILIILGLVVGMGLIYHFNPTIWSRTKNIFKVDKLPISSSGNRIILWETALEITRKFPLTGVGVGQFTKYADEIISKKITTKYYLPITTGHAHSNPIQILVTMGIVGIFFYFYLWFIIFREGFRLLRRAPPFLTAFSIGILSSLVGFHIEGFFEYNFGDSEIITLVWFLLGGMMAIARLEARHPTERKNP